MKLQSSYIFLPNPYNNKSANRVDGKDVPYNKTGHSLFSYIKKAFPNGKREHIDGSFFQQKYSFSIEIDGKTVTISAILKDVGESYYIDVVAEGNTKVLVIGALELFQGVLLASEVEEDYISIISYDAISEYYCNKLYPKLNELERNLRKLLFNIYVLNFGHEYFKATTTKEMQAKVKERIRTKGDKAKKETQVIQQYFYSLEYGDIQQLLFSPRWTDMDVANKAAFLKEHTDLSQLSDVELRNKINEISPKSDWVRFFAKKFDDVNVENEINIVRNYRNCVAHCKFLRKADYIDCDNKIRKLNRALKKAITITEEEDFIDKNEEYLRKTLSGISTRIFEMIVPTMQTIRGFARGVSSIIEKIAGTLEVSDVLGTAFSNLMDRYLQNPKIDWNVPYPNSDTSFISSPEEDMGEEERKDG